jgi:hypothetical protein
LTRTFAAALFLCIAVTGALSAVEYREGSIRLIINEETGSFSLYYLADYPEMRYRPLFTASDPRTTFLEVNVDGRIFRLGEAASFHVTLDEKLPIVVFESPFLVVRETFRFIKTNTSIEVNGVEITFQIENRDAQPVQAGMRFLLDTNLGEEPGKTPFVVDGENIREEALVTGYSGNKWWFSSNGSYSLAGSISGVGAGTQPSFLHFANWKLLNDVSWKAAYSRGRSFNYPPHSMGDSAVCYYFEPALLAAGACAGYKVILAALDGFLPDDLFVEGEKAGKLRSLLERLDRYIGGETLDSDEFSAIEKSASEIRGRGIR